MPKPEINIEALRAVKFAGDTTVSGHLIQAVIQNHFSLCIVFGYLEESEVPITRISVDESLPIPVVKGMYRSALWVWYWYLTNSESCDFELDGCSTHISFTMTEEAIASAREYFGVSICEDAKKEDTAHILARALLYGGEVQVVFMT